MPLMEWSDKFSVGINSIDEQHKKLVGMINTLFDALSQGKGDQALGPILSDLITYPDAFYLRRAIVFYL